MDAFPNEKNFLDLNQAKKSLSDQNLYQHIVKYWSLEIAIQGFRIGDSFVRILKVAKNDNCWDNEAVSVAITLVSAASWTNQSNWQYKAAVPPKYELEAHSKCLHFYTKRWFKIHSKGTVGAHLWQVKKERPSNECASWLIMIFNWSSCLLIVNHKIETDKQNYGVGEPD